MRFCPNEETDPFLRLVGTSNMVSSRLQQESEIPIKHRKRAPSVLAFPTDPQMPADAALDMGFVPFRGLVEILIGVNLLQTEVFLLNPERKMGLDETVAVIINALYGQRVDPSGGWGGGVLNVPSRTHLPDGFGETHGCQVVLRFG